MVEKWSIDRQGLCLLSRSIVGVDDLATTAHGRPLQIFKVFFYIFNYYFKKLSGTGKNYAYLKCIGLFL